MTDITTPDQIKSARNAAGQIIGKKISQSAAAKIIGVGVASWENWEMGKWGKPL